MKKFRWNPKHQTLNVVSGGHARPFTPPLETGCMRRDMAKAMLHELTRDHHEAERWAAAFANEWLLPRGLKSRWEITDEEVFCWLAVKRRPVERGDAPEIFDGGES